jgi:hypothetical protein
LVSPPYTAVMEQVPAARVEVLNVAWLDAFRVPVPSAVSPSLNATVPDGAPTDEVTRAVKVIA